MEPLAQARQAAASETLEARETLELLRAAPIQSDLQQEEMAGALREVKERFRIVDEKRRSFTDPLNKVVQGINDFFRPALDAYRESERTAKTKIAGYVAAKAAANAAALQIAATAATAEQATQAMTVISSAAPPRGVSIREDWKFEIVDASAVPREFCSPDPVKIGVHGRTEGEPPAIPGVRWFKQPVVTSRKVAP